ncbi:MAG: DUF4136 domain-containing protein [Thiogranum sp.]
MTRLLTAGVPLLLLLTACTTLTVRTDYETGYDFSTLQTYAWLEGKPPSNDIRINNSLIINRVVNAVNNSLQAKGYKLVDKDEADFYVNWLGGIEDKIRIETIDTYYGYLGYGSDSWGYRGYWPGYIRTYTYEYQQGTLIIDIADGRSKQLIWRGTGQDYLEEKENPEEITAAINHTVSEILAAFPPVEQPL